MPNFSSNLFSESNIETLNSFASITDSELDSPGPPAATSTPTGRGEPMHRRKPLNAFSCISMNCNSLKSLTKVAEFQEIVRRKSPDLILTCETKLSSDQATYSFLPPDYVAYRKDRSQHGGGVMLAHNQDIPMSKPTFLENIDGEMVWTMLESQPRPTYMCSFYTPNTQSAATNLDFLREALNRIFAHHRNAQPMVVIAGDFNLGDINWERNSTSNPQTSSHNQKLLDLMDEFGLVNTQVEISRPVSGKCLDLVLTNQPRTITSVHTACGMSDHLMIGFSINCKPAKPVKIPHKVFVFKKAKAQDVKRALNELSSSFFSQESTKSVNENWIFFRDGVHKIMNDHIPSKMSKTRHDLPWVTTRIKREMRRRDRLLNKAKRSQLETDWSSFRKQRNLIPKLIKQSYHDYINNIIGNSLADNPKTFWSYVRRANTENLGIPTLVDSDGSTHVTLKAKSERLNNHFQSQFVSNDDNEPLPSLPTSPHPSICNLRIGLEGVEKQLRDINPNKACGPDEIPARLYRDYAPELAPMLQCIFQKSYNHGIVPDDWKRATVTAIHKKGSTSDAKNYRPISLTVLACKFMEHICSSHINKFLAERNILSKYQHGFRQKLSCQTQLLEAVSDWSSSLNKKHCQKVCAVTVALFDFSKAFDRVCHARLLKKIDYYGIRGEMKEWIRSFLAQRSQRVSVQGAKSSSIHVTSGVPQGSVMGPLLFLLFINDIADNIDSQIRLFADDTILYREIWSQADHQIVQSDIDKLYTWSKLWKLDFNISKCKIIPMSLKRNTENFVYTINNNPIDEVRDHPYLGITINNKLAWSNHISDITTKATRVLNVIRRTLHPCSTEVKTRAYLALVRPRLEYAAAAWSPHTQVDVANLERVQRNAARFVLGDYNRDSSVTEMLKRLEWDTLEKRRMMATLITFQKIRLDLTGIQLPPWISASARDPLKYLQPTSRINAHMYAFYPRVIRLWNLLPAQIRNLEDIEKFEKAVASEVEELSLRTRLHRL